MCNYVKKYFNQNFYLFSLVKLRFFYQVFKKYHKT